MDKIIEFIMSTINSLLSNGISEGLKKKKDKREKYKFEEEVINNVEIKLKEVFEKEKIADWLSREQYNFDQKALLYDDVDKIQFIQNFFEKNNDLKYLRTKEIEDVICEYINRVNEIVNEILTPEGKILANTIKNVTEKHSNRVLAQIEKSSSEIKKQLNKIERSVDNAETKEHILETKVCHGYGAKNGICNNVVEKKDLEYCKECLEDEYMDKIINLYKIQKYNIYKEKKFFVAKQNIGIVQVVGVVFPFYSQTSETSVSEIYALLEEINQISDLNKYHFIHIVSNGTVETKHKELFSKYNATVYTEENIITQIMDFRFYLQDTIDEYKKSELKQHYIELYEEKTDKPLINSISDFINGNLFNALFILGDYGCGKTSFLLNLAYELSKEYLEGKSQHIPLFIPLKDYTKAISFENLFNNFFANKCNISNPSIEAFRLLLKYQKFVILFDGFDEVAKRVSYDVKLEIFNEICKFGINNTKIIVTCRPNYFQDKQEYKKLIENTYLHLEASNSSLDFNKTYIKELNEPQISKYINSFANNLKKIELNPIDVERFIKETHDLMDLAKRPFLLNIIVKTLPQLIQELKNKSGTNNFKINAANLYNKYVDIWLDRENLKGKTLIRKKDKLHFCKYIAYKMFIDGNNNLHFSMFPEEIRGYFKNLFNIDEIDYFSHDIQSCSFMNTDGLGNFKFIHESFMEYFVATVICERLKDIKKYNADSLNKTLSCQVITTEIALFINDILDDNQTIKTKIFSALKDNIDVVEEKAHENIITILTKTKNNVVNIIENGKEYIGNDFSHTTIKNKTIQNVNFSNASFYNANIENVKFTNCNFSNTYFQKATLKYVIFSRQNLEYTDMSYCVIENCKFVGSILIDSQISQATIINNDFEECDMSGINVENSILENNYCDDAIGIPYEFM